MSPPLPAGLAARLNERGIGLRHLYIHLPFCARICPYCDFSTAIGAGADPDGFLDALAREADLLGEAGLLDRLDSDGGTLFLGGGTPTWFDPARLARLLDWLGGIAPGPWQEATIEMNPEDADPELLEVLRKGGVNRLSIGAQSFDPAMLGRLGRTHEADDVATAVTRAHDTGFTVSLDLLFAIPGQTVAGWRSDLERALALEPEHLSIYNLTYEEGTPFHRWLATGRLTALDDAWEAEAYALAVTEARSAGLERYEVSHFARPGHASLHNQAYWTGASYLGLGPSAHSLLDRVRTAACYDLASWSAEVARGRVPWVEVEDLGDLEWARERVLLGLRTADGVMLTEIPAAFRAEVRANADPVVTAGHAAWTDDGRGGTRLVLTDEGMLLADGLAVGVAP